MCRTYHSLPLSNPHAQRAPRRMNLATTSLRGAVLCDEAIQSPCTARTTQNEPCICVFARSVFMRRSNPESFLLLFFRFTIESLLLLSFRTHNSPHALRAPRRMNLATYVFARSGFMRRSNPESLLFLSLQVHNRKFFASVFSGSQ